MEVLECIRTRRSIRLYLSVPIEWEKIGSVLEAGRLAPSSGNLQDWKFIVVTDAGLRKEIAKISMEALWMETAPVHIVVCADTEKNKRFYGIRGERLYSVQDCAAAVMSMCLAAHTVGLGTCWVGAFDEHALSRLLDIPEQIRPQAIVTVGYPDEKPEMPKRYTLENITFLDKWGNRIKDIGFVLKDYRVLEKAMQSAQETTARIIEQAGAKGQQIVEKGVQKIIKAKPGKPRIISSVSGSISKIRDKTSDRIRKLVRKEK